MKPETPGGTAALAKGLTLLDMVADAPEPLHVSTEDSSWFSTRTMPADPKASIR